MRTEQLKIWQNKKLNVPTLFLDYLSFVEEPTPYLQQGGCKMVIIIFIYLYLSSRLRENQTAQNITKQKNTGTLFFDLLSFCIKESPP